MVAMAQQRLEVVSLSVSNPKQKQKNKGHLLLVFLCHKMQITRLTWARMGMRYNP